MQPCTPCYILSLKFLASPFSSLLGSPWYYLFQAFIPELFGFPSLPSIGTAVLITKSCQSITTIRIRSLLNFIFSFLPYLLLKTGGGIFEYLMEDNRLKKWFPAFAWSLLLFFLKAFQYASPIFSGDLF